MLFHKESGDSMDGVHVSDFAFAFTTDRQLELLHQLGSGVLMMDVSDVPRGERTNGGQTLSHSPCKIFIGFTYRFFF